MSDENRHPTSSYGVKDEVIGRVREDSALDIHKVGSRKDEHLQGASGLPHPPHSGQAGRVEEGGGLGGQGAHER